MFSLHLHRVFAQIDETSGYADNTASCSDFSDAHGKEAKSVSGSLQFSVKIGGFWMILSDQVPRAPTCTDIPYQDDAKIF